MSSSTKANVYSFRFEKNQSSSRTSINPSDNWNDKKSRTFNKNRIKMPLGSMKKRKRIGRGQGSGKGGTSTRGHKGAKSRSGFSEKLGFEGGQLPLQRRLPKFGFTKKTKIDLTPEILKQAINITKFNFIKIIGHCYFTEPQKIFAHKFSKSSFEAIKSAGGEVIYIL